MDSPWWKQAGRSSQRQIENQNQEALEPSMSVYTTSRRVKKPLTCLVVLVRCDV
jgi:hypothetical protein